MNALTALPRDLRHAFRALGRRPLLSWMVVFTLGIGIGGNTALFTFLLEEHWTRIDAPDAKRLFFVRTGDADKPSGNSSYPSALRYQEALTGLGEASLWTFTSASLTPPADSAGHSIYGIVSAVSPGYFKLFGVHEGVGRRAFHHGRDFRDDEFAHGGAPVSIVDYTYWRRHLAADPEIIGKSIQIQGIPYTVVGVAPRGFENTGVPHTVYVPMGRIDELGRVKQLDNLRSRRVTTLFRMPGGAAIDTTREQALARLAIVGQSLDAEHPLETPRRFHLEPVEPGFSALDSTDMMLAGAVGLLLVLACANAANLMLTRHADRQHEIAVQMALGAGGWRIARRLLIESILLATGGGVLGLGFSRVITFLLVPFYTVTPIGYSAYAEGNQWRHFDERVLTFTVGVALFTALLSGLAPILHATRPDLVSALKGAAADRPGRRVAGRQLLVVTQVALSTVLVLTTALLGRSVIELQRRDPGFNTERQLILALTASPRVDEKAQLIHAQQEIYEAARRAVRHHPGVVGATLADGGPWMTTAIELPGRTDQDLKVGWMSVGRGFLETYGIAPRYGRGFNESDHARDRQGGSVGTVLVNKAFSDRFFDGEDALGLELRLPGRGSRVHEDRFTVVGVLPSILHSFSDEAPVPMVYLPLRQYFSGRPMVYLTVRVQGSPAGRLPDLRKVAAEAHPKLHVVDADIYERQVGSDLWAQRLHAAIVTLFSILGLVLACAGIYSAMSCAVSYRRREMGIRMTVGATSSNIVRLILAEASRIVLSGLVLGIAGALLVGQLVKSLLYGVAPHDPQAFLALPLLLAAVGMAAAWWPARRAGSVDPNIALHDE
ncbi:MAG: ABC transporter permease [Thermoanaerobaculia bacterium]|nr:ABC transporter permease [Thermoanaerobaculia bacterium]